MRCFSSAEDVAFVLEQRGALISQLADLEDLRARVLAAERIMLHRQATAVVRPDSVRLLALVGHCGRDRLSLSRFRLAPVYSLPILCARRPHFGRRGRRGSPEAQ
jgi:hypothetical protein